jgi:hypothetical protein
VGAGEQSFELVKSLLGLRSLGEVIRISKEPIQRKPFLPEVRDELVEGHEAHHDSLHPFKVVDWAHICDSRDLFYVSLDPTLRVYEPKEHASGNSKKTFLRVQPDSLSVEALESFV